MIKRLSVLAWFAWIVSALGQGQINLNNRGLALVNDSTGKPLTGTTFVAAVLYGSSEATINKSFLPSPFRASTTTYPGTWNPAATGGPGAIATLSGFNPGTTVTLKVAVWDTAVFATWEAAAAALQAGKSTVPTQAGLSAAFTYAIPSDPLAIPGGLEKFGGLKLTVLNNTGPANQPPTAVAQSLSVNSGQTLAITLAGSDPEKAPLTYTVVTQPVSGTLAGTGVSRVYTPKAGFSGSDSFTFKVNDGSLDSAVATVAITVKPVIVNQAPTAVAQSLSVNSGQTLGITLAGNDPEGSSLTYTVVTQPVSGTLAGTGVNRIYTPKAGFSGSDSFTFKVNDGSLDSAVATVAITVKPVTVNQAPTADSQNVSLALGETKDIGLTAKDPENSKLTYTIVTQPANGTLTGLAPALRYTPKAGFTGTDSFSFKVNDGSLDSAVATISISVSQNGGQINLNNRGLALVNDAAGKPLVGATYVAKIFYGASEAGLTQAFVPAPFRDATTTYPGTWNPGAAGGPGSIGTLSGFNPGTTVTLKVAVWDTAVFATWELAEAALKAGKNTVPTQAGLSAAFTYSIPTDPLAIPGGMEKFPGLKLTALSNTGPVNQVPTADSQTVSLVVGEARDIGLTGRDPENLKLTYTIVTQPANGTLTGIVPAIKYTPKAGFIGADSFTFKVNDGVQDSAVATISISVSEAGAQINLNNRGLALVNDAAGKPLVGANFAAKVFYGASEAALSQSFVASPFRDATTTYPGTWNPAAVGGPGAIATLAGFKLGATVTLKVAVWDTAVFATWELAEAALKAGKNTVPTQAGLSAAFTYTVPTDSLAIPGGLEKFPGLKLTALSTSGTINQAPTADSQTVSLATGEARDIGLTGRDPENLKLTFTIVTQPANGTLTGIAPAIKYTPKAGFIGADSFTFKVNDGSLDSAVATISILVSEAGAQINLNNRGLALVNDAAGKPLVGANYAAKILYGASEAALTQSFVASPFRDATTTYPGTWNPAAVGGPGAIATLAGFKLGSTVTLKVAVWDTAVFATWELAEAALKAGKNPVPTQAGLSTAFTYTVPSDSLAIPGGLEKFPGLKLTALSNTGPINQAPTAAGQSLSVISGQTLPIVLAGNDPEGASLIYTVVAPPANGLLSGIGANRVYTPKAGFIGSDSFTFKANDGALDSAVATVAITVKASTVVVTPPEFPTEPPPWDRAPCICGPLVGNYQTNQIHTWHVLADGGSLDLQLTTVTVNTNDPQTTIVDAFDGTNRIASVTVSYTAAEARANGLRWEKTASVNLGTFARGKVIRLESRIGGTPVTQTHYNLQFCGARWLAIDLPSFKALEEDHAAYRFNVKSGESLVLDLDNVGIPTPASAFRYRLISPLGVIVKSGTNSIVAGPELTVTSPSVGLWTLEMRPIGGEHYLLDKTTGADRHAYLDWYTSQRGVKEVLITVNGKPAVGVPFEVQLTRQREVGLPDPSDVVVTSVVTNGWARFIEIPNGYYKVDVRPLLKEIPAIDYQEDWIYCNSPVTNLFAFTRLNKLPVFDAIANTPIDEGKPFSLVVKATDPEGAPLTYSLVGGPIGLTVTSAGALTWTPSEDQGPSTNGVSVAVTDGIDSVTNRFTVVVREVNAAPQVATIAKQTLDEGKALALKLSATDTDLPKQPLVFQLTSGPAGLTVSTAGQVDWVAGEDFGGKTETVKFTVSDGVQTVASEFQVVINEVNAAPQVATIPKQTLDEGKALALSLVATDSDLPKQDLVFRLVSGPAGLTVSPSGLVAWATAEESGGKTETTRLTVSDGLVVVPVEFQVTVNEVNDAPSLSGVDHQTVDALKPLVIALTAKDSDLPTQKLLFGLTSGPKGMTVSEQGRLEWTPSIDQGGTTNTVEVSVNDGVAKASTSFVVVVRPSNTAPTLADVALRRVSETGSITFTLAASDNDQPAQKLTFALVSGPEGLSVNPNTGQVLFRPTEVQGPSTNRVVVRVTDNGVPALSTTNSFTVVVLEINQAPQLASVDNQTVEALKPWVIRLSAKDADIPAQKLTFGLVDGPAGMSVDPVEGIVSWTPSLDQASAQYPVMVSVGDGIRVVTQSFEINVPSANQAPFFINLVNRSVRELNTVNFRLIGRDLDQPGQKLSYALVSGPNGLAVSDAGQLTWTPTEAQGPSTNIVAVQVTDNGTPSLSTTNSFTLFVTEANTAPTLVNAFSRSILESAGLNFTLIGRDSDLPAQKLTYTLVSGPKGLTMTDAGVIAWSPTEEQGPSTNTVVVKVTDSAPSPLSTTASFVVTVREANAAPVFPSTNWTVVAQSKLSVALKATDVDIPMQVLSYRLERGPQGLTVSTNGLLEWTPASSLANTTNIVTVSVSDTVTRISTTFRVIVRPVGSGSGSETKALQRTYLALVVQPDQTLSLKVVGPEGARFRVESTTLLGVEWQTVDSIGEIQTLGENEPVVVPVPVEGTGDFRQFRLKKQ